MLASAGGKKGDVLTPFSDINRELPRLRVTVSSRRDRSYRPWHERGSTQSAVSVADLLACIVSLIIILFLWLQ
jgi:hypothetical protein